MFKSGFIKLGKKSTETKLKSPKVSNNRGVVYLGHIPHGFYKNEMKNYFTQFGEVTNINIPKSKKTGRARGFAFVEFLYPEVAKVVAETMNNYLMHKKILVAKYLPSDQVKSNTFWGCNKKKIPLTIKNRSIQRKSMERPLNSKEEEKQKMVLNKRLKKLQNRLKNKGIEYDIQTFKHEPSENNKITKETKDDNDDNLSENCLESDTNKESDEDEITPPKQKKQKKQNDIRNIKRSSKIKLKGQ